MKETNRKDGRIKRALQFAWVCLISFFIGVVIYRESEELGGMDWTRTQTGLVLLAIGVSLLRKLAGCTLWVLVVNTTCPKPCPNTGQSMRAYFISNLSMYLPGTYWYILSRISMMARYGVSRVQTSICLIIEQAVILVAAGLIGLISLRSITELYGWTINSLLWISFVALAGLAIIHPRITGPLIDFATGRGVDRTKLIRPTYRSMLILVSCGLVVWLLGGVMFYIICRVFDSELKYDIIGLLTAVWAIAWLAGFVTPFAPNGIGTREGVLTAALVSLGMPMGFALIASVLTRIVVILEDLLWAVVAYFFLSPTKAEHSFR